MTLRENVTNGTNMALADFLKRRLLNPFGVSVYQDVQDLMNRPRTTGSEPLNPAAQQIRLRSLQQKNAPARQQVQQQFAASQPQPQIQAVQPAPQQIAPAPITPSQPAPVPVQDQNVAARAQLEQEAQQIAQTGSAQPQAQAESAPTADQSQSGQDPELQAPTFTPIDFSATYRKAFDDLGLGDIRAQIDKEAQDLQDLQDKKTDEIALVNENPWLSEGARQKRVQAINNKYEQREANLLNRLQLFQTSFEQGREEAQFLATNQANEARAQREFTMEEYLRQADLAEARAEAERKLSAAGNEVLSVADARALGIPYGTTVAEARKLGVIPEGEQKLQPGIVGEYQFYAQQEAAAGRQPVSFDEYQTRDANRKYRIASAANSAGLTSTQTNTALKLSDDFEQASKNFKTVADSYNRINAASTNPTGAGDISLIFAYMKMLDPASVVREGEFATAQNSGSIPDNIRASYNKAVSGKRLSDKQRNDFVSRANTIYQGEKRQQDQTTQSFVERAVKLGLPPDLVVREVGATSAPTSQPVKTGTTKGGTGYTVRKTP